MLWFKHFSNARHDEFLMELREEFGKAGVDTWWCLVEFVAENMTAKNPTPQVVATPQAWARETFTSAANLRKIVHFCAKRGKLKYRVRATRLSVEIPKLLQFKDEYTERLLRMSGHSPDKSRDNVPKEQTTTKEDVRKDKRKTGTRKTPPKSENPIGNPVPLGPADRPVFGIGYRLLLSEKIRTKTAGELAETYTVRRIYNVLQAVKESSPNNRPGWIIDALSKSYEVPDVLTGDVADELFKPQEPEPPPPLLSKPDRLAGESEDEYLRRLVDEKRKATP